MAVKRIALIGFSGTGKSAVARLLAQRLGWDAADTDAEIERSCGIPIPTIFREHGEAAFRASERAILGELLERDHVVVATGGGAPVAKESWDRGHLGRDGTLVLALDALPETILGRLVVQANSEGAAVERPLLAAADPLARIRTLKAERQHVYDAADLTLAVDTMDAAAVADEAALIVRSAAGEPLALMLEAASADSAITVSPGSLQAIGPSVRKRWPMARRAWIVSDTNVGSLYAGDAERSLNEAGFLTRTYLVAPGEASKSLGVASALYDWMLGNGVERGDVVIALGGGVVGDLAGFVAATTLRGLGLVQAPTSLLAAVDSSVGGKTGVNHAAGKNLIGSFLQPQLVIVDTNLLRTLPPRELRSGWGEIVKHAVIQRSTPGGERNDLAAFLSRNRERLKNLDSTVVGYLVWRNVALKAAVVAVDEREAGIRAYLNFGHTLGHAIEAADYQLLHGEAVAVGMAAAARLGVLAETCDEPEAERIRGLIGEFDLPLAAACDEVTVMARLGSDKKRVAGRQRYVLPLNGGGVTLRDDLSDAAVTEALASVLLTGASV